MKKLKTEDSYCVEMRSPLRGDAKRAGWDEIGGVQLVVSADIARDLRKAYEVACLLTSARGAGEFSWLWACGFRIDGGGRGMQE
jgi:hypothetical protein